jgi:threonine/homoserine/homoserine lactone efflux protein
MNVSLLLRGILLGLSIAAPVGPIGILCIRRTLRDGRLAGFVSGMGAATADAAYGCVVAFGLTAVSSFLLRHRLPIALLGGAFLCYLGVRTFLSRPPAGGAPPEPRRLLQDWSSTFLLTLANPATVLSFVAVFAAFGPAASSDLRAAGSLVLGVFAGSAAWWLVLSAGVGAFRSRIGPGALQLVNRLSGAVLIAFGVLAIARA